MPTYTTSGWIWAGFSVTTLIPVTIEDDDPNLSPYFTNDFTEEITIAGTTYTNPRGGVYELTFDDSGGTSHTEDFHLWYTGSNFIFIPMPGSSFDSGSTPTGLGGWQSWTTEIPWDEVACFTQDTEILTVSGLRPIQHLQIGDLVETYDRGAQPIRWIGKRTLGSLELDLLPNFRPVVAHENAFGQGKPNRPTKFSPQHRVMIQSHVAELYFGEFQVLAPIKSLVNQRSVLVDNESPTVTYFHLLFDQHEIVWSNGLATESFFPGDRMTTAARQKTREETVKLFPELERLNVENYVAARTVLKVREGQLLR